LKNLCDKFNIKATKVAIAMHCHLKANVARCASRFMLTTNSTTPQGMFRQSLSIYKCLWSNLYCTCA